MARQVAQVVADPWRCNLVGIGHQDDQTLSSAVLSATAQGALYWHQQVCGLDVGRVAGVKTGVNIRLRRSALIAG